MVRIRMQRLGRTHRPFYRICAIDQRTRRNGKVIERLGWYNPIEKDKSKQVELNVERVQYWLSMGAQPSETMEDMLGNMDILPPKRKAAWEARRAKARARVEGLKKAEEEAAAAQAAEQAKAAAEAEAKAAAEAKAKEAEAAAE